MLRNFTHPGFIFTRPKRILKPNSLMTGFKKSLSPMETLPEQIMNVFFSHSFLMVSCIEANLQKKSKWNKNRIEFLNGLIW